MFTPHYATYIMASASGVLYIGMTNNIRRRVREHRDKQVEGFSKKYNTVKLVHYEIFATAADAITREKELKGWLRKKKIALIEEHNPKWLDIAEHWFDPTLPDEELPEYVRERIQKERDSSLRSE